jgi:hypothetical protein
VARKKPVVNHLRMFGCILYNWNISVMELDNIPKFKNNVPNKLYTECANNVPSALSRYCFVPSVNILHSVQLHILVVYLSTVFLLHSICNQIVCVDNFLLAKSVGSTNILPSY